MFQVMIVDDEKAIRENLPALINFEAHGFRVCGTAKNGQDALEKWESCRPDVIFLDVRMPVMDGLTFLGKLQERTQTLPDIVMLSGYSDFEYARTAMRYGVRAYLTKPVDEEEVEALLEELSASLEEKRRESKKADIQEQVLSVKQMYHNGDGDRTPLREYRLMHCVVMDDSAIQEEAYRTVRETIEDRLPGGAGAFCRNRGSVLSYLISPRALEEYQYSTTLFGRHLLYQLKKQKLECALLFDGALFGRSEGTFRNDYDQHLYQMMTEIFWGGNFLQDNSALQAISDRRLEGEEEYLEQLKKAMRDRDHAALRDVYDRLDRAVCESRLSLVFLQEVSYRIYYLLTDILSAKETDTLRLEPLDWRNEACFLRYEEWSRQLWEQIDTAFAHMQGQEDAGQGLAMKVAAHARQHFREPITLKDTAERFFMSSAYLGRIFQKAVGVPFKQYVNDLRIEEAKRLLRQTDKLIYEIAEETGFAESKYFVARFTAAAGVSPMEYRKEAEGVSK